MLPLWLSDDEEPLLEVIFGELESCLRSYSLLDDKNFRELRNNASFMATRGAASHTDCFNVDWEPTQGIRIPLAAGQLIVFDPAQPHAVKASGQVQYRHIDFPETRRQAYLGGHISYDEPFWSRLGVSTHLSRLRSHLLDIKNQRINARNGRVVLKTR